MCVIRLDSFKRREPCHKIIMLFSKRAGLSMVKLEVGLILPLPSQITFNTKRLFYSFLHLFFISFIYLIILSTVIKQHLLYHEVQVTVF